MHIWHGTNDAQRLPVRVSAGERIRLSIGTWPVESGQSVWVLFRAQRESGAADEARVEAVWQRNENGNSYWEALVGPFENGTSLTGFIFPVPSTVSFFSWTSLFASTSFEPK
jgi:hypothetical protein